MATWRSRVQELDPRLVWAMAADGEHQKSKVKGWIISWDEDLAANEARLETVLTFVLSLRFRAWNNICSQFILLRNRNSQQMRDIHVAARSFEKEFAQLLAAERVD